MTTDIVAPTYAGRHPHDTDIPARLDRLPWSRWHARVVLALGITWILDGLEVTVVGALGSALEARSGLSLTSTQVGLSGSVYIAGAILGALVFGALTDRLGRKRLFMVTLGVYLVATALTATSWSFASFAFCRFATGAGIGGECAAMNSAIDELLPARVRGWCDLGINGSFWIGTAIGAALSLLILDPAIFPPTLGWRLGFGVGSIMGFAILLVRRHLPESPRWLMTRGRVAEADAIVTAIEREVLASSGLARLPPAHGTVRIHPHGTIGLRVVARTLLTTYRGRSAYALTLMIAQAFFYNAIFFTYALVLSHFYGVPAGRVGLYILPFAIGNFLGPLLLGRLFDSVGRRVMIAATYVTSGVLLAVVAWAFGRGMLTATTQTVAWSVIFFFASAAASSAYLTVSEIFPLEMRALAIAVFYAVGTGTGGVIGPALFGALVQSGRRSEICVGYLIGAALMVIAGGVALVFGVDAERKGLEEITAPLGADARAAGPLSARP